MKKKQLLSQSKYLFAEIERKANEIEGLKLKIEEEQEKYNNLMLENEKLLKELEKQQTEYSELEEINNQLRTELLKSLSVAENTPKEENETITAEEQTPPPVADIPKNQEPETLPLEKEAPKTEEIISPSVNTTNEKTKPFTPVDDAIRDYGAILIGKITRITAGIIAKISKDDSDASKSLNTLALGKNESFKYQILSVAQSGKTPDEIKAEMNILADEAIAYLESLA